MEPSRARKNRVHPPAMEMLLLVAAVLLATLPFWFSDLDLQLARLFYRPGNPGGAWPFEAWPLWRFFYHAAPVVSAVLGLGALLVYGYSRLSGRLWRRRPALMLIFLTFLLGAGVLVNAVFKDHWQHPRPRQTIELGGQRHYVPPLAIGHEGGKSFPSGHASVGFALVALWFVWRRRHFRLAVVALLVALGLGLAMGIGRMAAGGHYFSDVLWSGILVYATAMVLYYYVLKLPQREIAADETGALPARPRKAWLGWAALAGGVGLLLFALLGIPMARDVHDQRSLAGIHAVQLIADQADVKLVFSRKADSGIDLRAAVRSFGFPNNHVEFKVETTPPGRLVYHLTHVGLYTEIDTRLTLALPATGLQSVEIDLKKGAVEVRGRPDPSVRLRLPRSGRSTPALYDIHPIGHTSRATDFYRQFGFIPLPSQPLKLFLPMDVVSSL